MLNSHRARLIAGAAALLIALALIAISLAQRPDAPAKPVAQTSKIWKPGTAWQVSVTQDGASVSPEDESNVFTSVYRFRLESAPTKADGAWVVSAKMDGAVGPWEKGYTLRYFRDGEGFLLRDVALAGREPMQAKYARIILGQGFPLQERIDATPKSRKLGMAAHGGSAALPPVIPDSVARGTSGDGPVPSELNDEAAARTPNPIDSLPAELKQ